jgi:hypothetical protein
MRDERRLPGDHRRTISGARDTPTSNVARSVLSLYQRLIPFIRLQNPLHFEAIASRTQYRPRNGDQKY